KLFVFGDSYADTGNVRKSISTSWKVPYGITFPGRPAGRFSDGRVLTDYLGGSPLTRLPFLAFILVLFLLGVSNRYGMNFAFGGTGVFNTLSPDPNMTTQIDLFQQLLTQRTYSAWDLHNSVALVSVAGNDYATFLSTNRSLDVRTMVNQTTQNLLRLKSMGIKKIVVTGLQPLGCLPATTSFNSFQQCNETRNQLVALHNFLLRQTIADLNPNNGTAADGNTFVLLDLFQAFMAVLKVTWNPLKPCCVGMSSGEGCGSVDVSTGGKRYTVCEDPKAAFFWDTVHPTQEGWRAVYFALKSNLLLL
ncbi:GDSL esterase/lipase At5g03610, partial [Linum perenne]